MGFAGALLRQVVPAKCIHLGRVELVTFLTELSAAQLGAEGWIIPMP